MTLHFLIASLVFLVLLSGFFSGSETAMMSINRYRLRHLVRSKNRAAKRVNDLLKQTDKLLGIILIGNTFANILASALATMIAVNLLGDIGVLVATVLLTFVVLIFAEITPKTLAAHYPQHLAFFVSLPLKLLLWVLYPVVWVATAISNGILRLFRVNLKPHTIDRLNHEELRSVVMESTGRISDQHQDMLIRILDLEKMTVDDVMVPNSEMKGIELDDDWSDILKLLTTSPHTLLPVYRDGIHNMRGVVNLRKVLNLLTQGKLNKSSLESLITDAYFIPEGTSLSLQMLNFKKEQQRLALVVDEYGDIQGLVTVEDILEEIVGELASEVPSISKLVLLQADGSFLVDGSVNVRELNRLMNWNLPIEGPKTLSGLIIEYLETIPEAATSLMLNDYPIEIMDIKDNLVKTAKIFSKTERLSEEEHL